MAAWAQAVQVLCPALKVVALLGAAGALYGRRERIVDRLVDVTARRPSGMLGRLLYRNPRAHFASFDATLGALALEPADRLLEVACGGGTFLERALAGGCEAKAIDYSPDMVALARELNTTACHNGRLEVLQARAEQMPHRPGSAHNGQDGWLPRHQDRPQRRRPLPAPHRAPSLTGVGIIEHHVGLRPHARFPRS